MYRLRIERGLIPGELSLALSHFRGAFVGCRRWIKSVKILSDALMEDLKAATRKNEILFKNNYVLLNLYARITVCIMFHYCDSMFYGNNYTVYLFKEVKCLIFKYSLYISVPHFFGNFRYVPCLSARHPKLIQMV